MARGHKPLRIAMLVHGILDLIGALLLLIYPQIVTVVEPLLSINFFTERMVAGALFAVGGASLYAWGFNERQRFADLLVMKVIWSNAVWIGYVVTFIQKPELFTVGPGLVMIVFVLGAATWTAFLFAYTQKPATASK